MENHTHGESTSQSEAAEADRKVGRRIADRIADLGIESEALAAKLCVPTELLDQWLSGDRRPKPDQLAAVAALLDVPVTYFFKR